MPENLETPGKEFSHEGEVMPAEVAAELEKSIGAQKNVPKLPTVEEFAELNVSKLRELLSPGFEKADLESVALARNAALASYEGTETSRLLDITKEKLGERLKILAEKDLRETKGYAADTTGNIAQGKTEIEALRKLREEREEGAFGVQPDNNIN